MSMLTFEPKDLSEFAEFKSIPNGIYQGHIKDDYFYGIIHSQKIKLQLPNSYGDWTLRWIQVDGDKVDVLYQLTDVHGNKSFYKLEKI